jgi:thiosulfate dehydrogenase
MKMERIALLACAFSIAIVISAAIRPHAAQSATPAPVAAHPAEDEAALIADGKNIFEQTRTYAGAYVGAGMSCESCHISAGTKAHGLSLVGVYATFPQYNARANRFIALQDRIAECFFYSMNGTPPAYDSREMIALTAYLVSISRGTVVGEKAPGQGLITFDAPHTPSVENGATVYAAKCLACHGADGDGGTAFPPLWGKRSFNAGAGMHRLGTMAAFVRYNMPYGSPPNTLTAQEAYDVSAFVLSHPRPSFDGSRVVSFPDRTASFY